MNHVKRIALALALSTALAAPALAEDIEDLKRQLGVEPDRLPETSGREGGTGGLTTEDRQGSGSAPEADTPQSKDGDA